MTVKTNTKPAGAWLAAAGLLGTLGGMTAAQSGAYAARPASGKAPAGGFVRKDVNAETREKIQGMYRQLPLSFEANQGQAPSDVRFLSRGAGYSLYLTPSEAVLSLRTPAKGSRSGRPETRNLKSETLRMRLVGGNRKAAVAGERALPNKSHYFSGRRPSGWRTDVPNYAQVRYDEVYPGVDMVYYGNQGQLEYDFVVAPGADPKQIGLAFSGVRGVRIDKRGDLLLKTPAGEVRQQRPFIYQEVAGVRKQIQGKYILLPGSKLETRNSKLETPRVGFEVAAYDARKPLVIDPTLTFATYLGGDGADQGLGIAVDAFGSAYVTGTTASGSFPVQNPINEAPGGGLDVFVSKLNATGSALVYSTFLGGGGQDRGNSIAVDAAGNAYVTGITVSDDFPVTDGALDTSFNGVQDAFVTQISRAGSALIYSTYLGGNGQDFATDIALDVADSAYVTGHTESTDLVTSSEAPQGTYTGGSLDAFAVKINPAGTALVYATYLGGNGVDLGASIAVDPAGSAYVAGSTGSTNFPTTANAASRQFAGGNQDAFLTRIDPAGATFDYSTFLGGSGLEQARGVAVDEAGLAYVVGSTTSDDFPTTGGVVGRQFRGGTDAFVMKVDPAQGRDDSILYSTYLGGAGLDQANGVAVDTAPDGEVFAYITGVTDSANFPTATTLHTLRGRADAFVAKLNGDGDELSYSTYFGGTGYDEGFAIAVDADGDAYVTGITNSANLLTTGALQSALGGDFDAFVAKVPQLQPEPVAPSRLGATAMSSRSVRLSFADNTDDETGFQLERRAGNGEFTLVQTLEPDTTTFTDTGLDPNTVYSYRLRALAPGGLSPFSNVANVRTQVSESISIRTTPRNLSFNTIRINRTTSETLRIQNTGSVTVTITIDAPVAPFGIDGESTFELEPGESARVRVLFAPTTRGRFTQQLRINAESTEGGGTRRVTVGLSATAQPARRPRLGNPGTGAS